MRRLNFTAWTSTVVPPFPPRSPAQLLLLKFKHVFFELTLEDRTRMLMLNLFITGTSLFATFIFVGLARVGVMPGAAPAVASANLKHISFHVVAPMFVGMR